MQLVPQRLADRLDRELRRTIRPDHHGRDPAADRPDEHDAAAGRPDQRQHRLGHRHLPHHVHFQLLAPLRQRQVLQRAAPADTRVVHHAIELAGIPGDLAGDGVHLALIGHIQEHRNHPVRAALTQPPRVLLFPDAGIHPMPEAIQVQRTRFPDAARRASHQDSPHGHSLHPPGHRRKVTYSCRRKPSPRAARLVVALLVPVGQPVTVAIDDTLFRRRGKKSGPRPGSTTALPRARVRPAVATIGWWPRSW